MAVLDDYIPGAFRIWSGLSGSADQRGSSTAIKSVATEDVVLSSYDSFRHPWPKSEGRTIAQDPQADFHGESRNTGRVSSDLHSNR